MFSELHPARPARDEAASHGPTRDPLSAADEFGRLLGVPPALAGETLRGGTRLTRRWRHGAARGYLPAMTGHVLITGYGAAQDIAWRRGAERLGSRIRPGSITQIPQGHDGHLDIGGPLEVSHIYLSDRRLQHCGDEMAGGRRVELIDRVGFDDPTTARIMDLLSHEAIVADPGSRLFLEQTVDLLCLRLVRCHSAMGVLSAPPPRRGLAAWQVKRVTDYMREHLEEDLRLEVVARLVGLSRFHFCTAFRLATGETPHSWLTALRMGRARQLLAERGLPITQIALAVGYQTPSAFTATFRRTAQVTPSAFRRAL